MTDYSIENWLPEYDELIEGEFERHEGLKWPITEKERAEKIIHAQEAEQTEIGSLTTFCKAEAKRRIIVLLNVSPGADYRDVEANMLAKMGELLDYKIDFPLDDRSELNGLKEIWSGIKDIRIASNLIEPDISNGTIKTEGEISTDERWPA